MKIYHNIVIIMTKIIINKMWGSPMSQKSVIIYIEILSTKSEVAAAVAYGYFQAVLLRTTTVSQS